MHVFISYAKKDSRALAADLEARISAMPNFTAWMDNELTPASSWSQQISSEIDRCDYFLVLLSPDVNRPRTETQDSSFVLNEIAYALAQRKTVLVAMASQTKVPLELADEQYIDFTQDLELASQKLLNYLANAANQATPTVTATAPANTIQMPRTINVTTNTAQPASWNLWAKLNTGGKVGVFVGLILSVLGIMFPAPDMPNIMQDPAGNIGGSIIVILIAAAIGQVVDWARMRFFITKA